MRLDGQRESENVEDRRRGGGGFGGFGRGGGGGGFRLGGGRGLGIGGTILVVVLGLVFGFDPSAILGGGSTGGGGYTQGYQDEVAIGPGQGGVPGAEDALASTTKKVLATTEDVWSRLFAERGEDYQEPVLVLFSGAVQSGCGNAQSAMGPFYCPADGKLYIDLSFYQELRDRMGAPGDFAQAYVLAHEVGHHVQNLLGISGQVQAARRERSKEEGNALSVRLELQADCFAGVWAHHADSELKVVEPGDVNEAIAAAAAVGDDRLMRQAGRPVVEESFTHGSSEQRAQWFQRGVQTGKMEACNTFEGVQ